MDTFKSIADAIIARGDLAHLVLFLWAGGASLLVPRDFDAERSRLRLVTSNMVYELDCEGVSLAIRIFPDGPQEQSWRMEASARGATGDGMLALSANGTTRAAALEELSRMWRENDGLTRAFGIDWTAVASALAAVRAV